MVISLRLPRGMLERLDALAQARGVNRSRVLRQMIAEASTMTPTAPAELPDEAELLDVLAEKARGGNVAAVRLLLDREKARRATEAGDGVEVG